MDMLEIILGVAFLLYIMALLKKLKVLIVPKIISNLKVSDYILGGNCYLALYVILKVLLYILIKHPIF